MVIIIGEKCSDSRCILKVEIRGFLNRFDVQFERKRGIQG